MAIMTNSTYSPVTKMRRRTNEKGLENPCNYLEISHHNTAVYLQKFHRRYKGYLSHLCTLAKRNLSYYTAATGHDLLTSQCIGARFSRKSDRTTKIIGCTFITSINLDMTLFTNIFSIVFTELRVIRVQFRILGQKHFIKLLQVVFPGPRYVY